MQNNIKSIGELVKGKFVFEIPSYQRGYRWEAKQVEDLLDDIFDFVTKKENVDSYFLQPIVVKKKDSGEGEVWSVLDGQQRITTLLLIMEQLIKYLSRADCEEYKELFTKVCATVCAGRTPSGSAATPRPSSLCFRAF